MALCLLPHISDWFAFFVPEGEIHMPSCFDFCLLGSVHVHVPLRVHPVVVSHSAFHTGFDFGMLVGWEVEVG